MINTIYGPISENLLKDFCLTAGYRYKNGSWSILEDEVEYWQLTAPSSTVEEKKWQKRKGWLPIRDLNFQYSLYQTFVIITGADKTRQIKVFDIEKAIKYAKAKLFLNENPVYLPDLLANKLDPCRDQDKKPKSYNQILEQEKENFYSSNTEPDAFV